ncbi:unnamed protein product [Polarella glacialis]|uniref:Pentatricopeptide repeat-containing protein n=1 Tax=Polarella glacialis TaxID=89957 RepID=A0A813KUB5_POLGL|nr:unnamed protein product [Polarella glacialis]
MARHHLGKIGIAVVMLTSWWPSSLEPGFAAQPRLDQIREKMGTAVHTRAADSRTSSLEDLPAMEQRLITEVSTAGSARDWPRARLAFDRSAIPNTRLFTAVMLAAFRCGQYQFGANVYTRLCNLGLIQDCPVYGIALRLFSKLGQVDKVDELCKEAQEKVPCDLVLFSTMIDAVAEAGDVHKAVGFLDQMTARNVTRDRVAWTSAINACKNARNALAARHLLKCMMAEGVEPDIVTFANVAGAHFGANVTHLTQLRNQIAELRIDLNPPFLEIYVSALAGRELPAAILGDKPFVDELSLLDESHLTDMISVIAEARAKGIRLSKLLTRISSVLSKMGFT